ncbi:MAG TPA: DNA polymerase III subunit beta [Candidatus Paceibacterota bacterium]
MKIETTVKQIFGIIDKAVRATGKNLSLPVLSCVYMTVDKENGMLKVKSTNLDIGLELSLKVKCEESGVVAVPAQVFLGFLSSIKNDSTLTLALNNGNLSVSTKNNSSVIKCIPSEDFPEIPKVSSGKETTIKPKEFINGIKSVWYSASNSSIKPELSSVYIAPGEQELLFVSTDSFRLAEKKVHYKKPTDFQSILLPSKNIPDIIKIIESYDEEIKISFDKNQVSFTFTDGFLVSRIVEGSFPDYKQIIPKSSDTFVTVLKNDFVSTIRSAQVFSDAFNQVRFKVNPKDRKFTIATKNNDVGEYTEDVPAKIEGEEMEISFNHKYILDCMQSIDSDSLELKLSGAGKPMIIQGAGDKSFSYVVMPMNR